MALEAMGESLSAERWVEPRVVEVAREVEAVQVAAEKAEAAI